MDELRNRAKELIALAKEDTTSETWLQEQLDSVLKVAYTMGQIDEISDAVKNGYRPKNGVQRCKELRRVLVHYAIDKVGE